MSANKTDGRITKGEATRQRLVSAALKVFAELGFSRATIKDIGAAAGVSPALLYYYFPSKEDLLNAVVERFGPIGDVRRFIEQYEALPAAEFIRKLARHFYDLLGERLDLVRIFLREGTSNESVADAWRGMIQRGLPVIQGYFLRQVLMGRLRPHNTEVTVRALSTTIVMLRFSENVFPLQTLTGHQFMDEFIDNLMVGLLPDTPEIFGHNAAAS
jgi:TetR/AcrR family transcriptional regulator, cholesterol catabolism regulator